MEAIYGDTNSVMIDLVRPAALAQDNRIQTTLSCCLIRQACEIAKVLTEIFDGTLMTEVSHETSRLSSQLRLGRYRRGERHS